MGFDVFQVNSGEAGFHQRDSIYKPVYIGGVEFEVEAVYVGKLFKQYGFTFHHRL